MCFCCVFLAHEKIKIIFPPTSRWEKKIIYTPGFFLSITIQIDVVESVVVNSLVVKYKNDLLAFSNLESTGATRHRAVLQKSYKNEKQNKYITTYSNDHPTLQNRRDHETKSVHYDWRCLASEPVGAKTLAVMRRVHRYVNNTVVSR